MAKQFQRMRTRRELLAGSAGVMLAAAGVAIPLTEQGKLRTGTRVGGTDVSGMSEDAATAKAKEAFAGFEAHAISFTWQDRRWDASLADLGLAIDYPAMLDATREPHRLQALADRYASFFNVATGESVPVIYQRDDAVLRQYVTSIASEIDVKAVDAQLAVTGGDVEVVPSVVGRSLDVERAITEATGQIATATPGTVALQTSDIHPTVTTEALAGKRDELRALVVDPVTYTLDGDSYVIEATDLASALRLDASGVPWFDGEALKPRLDQIAAAVAISPKNVMLGWNDGLYVEAADEPGRQLDRETLLAGLLQVTAANGRKAAMPIQEIPAAAREDNVADLGIEGHLAWGGSSFAGSSTLR